MQREFEDIVFAFAREVSKFESVQTLVLFGSVARGEADNRSDLDFLVVSGNGGPAAKMKERGEISRIALDLESKYGKNVQVVFSNKDFDGIDRQFVETVFREGTVLYGKEPEVGLKKLKLKPHSLIFYSMKNMKTPDKMRLRKALYGHETRKEYKGRVYEGRAVGLVETFGGKRTGIASILIPGGHSRELESVLKRFGAEHEKIDVWVSEA